MWVLVNIHRHDHIGVMTQGPRDDCEKIITGDVRIAQVPPMMKLRTGIYYS